MKTLREVLQDAEARKVAVGHFNISDIAGLKGIFEAAHELNFPILIGVSEGEREFIGVKKSVAIVRSLRDTYNFPIFINADHTHVMSKVEEAARAGFDEILFDGSAFPFDENIRRTKEAVALIKSIDPNIIVEGEIGYIGSSSEIIDKRPEESLRLSMPEEAIRFVRETGVDVLAPAVGNMHGLLKEMVTGEVKKRLDIPRIAEIKKAAGVFMTLHGGSGTADEDFKAAIKNGMTIVHVSSELRLAWRRGVEAGLKNPNEIAPYKILTPAVAGIKQIVLDRLKLFNS